MDIKAITELLPHINHSDMPFQHAVTQDDFFYLTQNNHYKIPSALMPPFMHNEGNYIVSLGQVCEFLGQQAEALGVEIYAGMSVSEPVFNDDNALIGVVAGVFGIAADGSHKADYQEGMEIHGKYILCAEGTRGSLSQNLIKHYHLDAQSCPQKYGLGLKEVWEIKPEKFTAGRVLHTMGAPLNSNAGGGGFLYMGKENTISLGMVVHLDYKNPTLSPYDEFQQMKHHPVYADILQGGRRISYGARAINEGGIQSLPDLAFKGGLLIGCSAGFVNLPRIKGSHNAILSGMLGAVAAVNAIARDKQHDVITEYTDLIHQSDIMQELKIVRNVKPLWSKFGLIGGVILGGLDMWTNHLFGVSLFGTLKHKKADHETLSPIDSVNQRTYLKPDGILSFDKLTNVSFTATNHSENQRCHLTLIDKEMPIQHHLPKYGVPSRLYCPAGVYELVYDQDNKNPEFKINSQNCIHCKTCDIKDPQQNIIWTTPEGSGGPNYSGM